MPDISARLSEIRRKIETACARSSRNHELVNLIAVSKTFPAESVREAIESGQMHFGESKLQEAESKIAQLPGSAHWHFIGRVQRNKLRKILQNFEVVHAIDSLKLASSVNETAKELGIFPKIFLQVNIGDEISKGGYGLELLHSDMESLLALERLEILGLMCIPPAGPDAEAARPWFAALRNLRDSLELAFDVRLPFLSMGMSGDFEIAIEEGATHVRVGSAIFGKRTYQVDGELG